MQELEKILDKIEAEHSYKVSGDRDTYSQYNEGWSDAIDRMRGVLENLDDGWIPVEERRPEAEQEHVLACRRDGSIDTARYSPYSDRWYVGSMCSVSLDVIAWRPLPEPYRPERSRK